MSGRVKGTIATISMEAYAAEMAMREASVSHEQHLREQATRAKTDRSLQCHHGVSHYDNCDPCAIEVGDPAPGPHALSMADLLGVS